MRFCWCVAWLRPCSSSVIEAVPSRADAVPVPYKDAPAAKLEGHDSVAAALEKEHTEHCAKIGKPATDQAPQAKNACDASTQAP